MVGLLVLTQLTASSAWNVSDWLLYLMLRPTDSLTLDDSYPDGDPLAIMGRTVGDDDLPLTPVLGIIPLVSICLWPTRYLTRPRLLTRS
jgi:hypothetical protein